MRKHTGPSVVWLSALLVLAGTAATLPVPAEVSAEVDPEGRYVRMLIVSRISADEVSIWSVARPRLGYVPLNPQGDAARDLWPVIVEDPNQGNRPWVVWSRFNGMDYDLAWSRWGGPGWGDVRWLQQTPAAGDDIDPHLTLDESGRPYVAWWVDDGGIGRIYFSMYLDTRWMNGYLVSDQGVDSRFPDIHASDDGSITVEYETPSGPVTKRVVFSDGVSINDDLDPIGSVTVKNSLGN